MVCILSGLMEPQLLGLTCMIGLSCFYFLCVEIILNIIHPFNRFVGKDMMSDLKYPLKDNTVPLWTVPVSFLY